MKTGVPIFAFLFVMLTSGVNSVPTHAQVDAGFVLTSVEISVDISSPTSAHVTRSATILAKSMVLEQVDWGLWYQGKTIVIAKVTDKDRTLGYIYPTPNSQPDRPILRILFAKSIRPGQSYDFTYEYDVTSTQESMNWAETLNTSEVRIESLTITIKLPTGYSHTGIEPASATSNEIDGRTQITWTGTNLYGQPSVGVTVGFGPKNQFTINPTSFIQYLSYVGAVAILGSLVFFGLSRIRATRTTGQHERLQPEAILQRNIGEATRLAQRDTISTGFSALDYLLRGGLPKTSTTILTSPVCDERDTIIRKFLEAGCTPSAEVIYVAREASKIHDLLASNESCLKALTERAREETRKLPNVQITERLENLTALNIDLMSLAQASQNAESSKRICLDLLDDVLLVHKRTMTRKWLSQLLPRLNNLGFTVLGVLNSEMHPSSDMQVILDSFDAQLELSQREIENKPRMILRIRKMSRGNFLDAEVALGK